jgi:hypothetical protein
VFVYELDQFRTRFVGKAFVNNKKALSGFIKIKESLDQLNYCQLLEVSIVQSNYYYSVNVRARACVCMYVCVCVCVCVDSLIEAS